MKDSVPIPSGDFQLVDEYQNLYSVPPDAVLSRGGQGVVYQTTDDDLLIKRLISPDAQAVIESWAQCGAAQCGADQCDTDQCDKYPCCKEKYLRIRSLPFPPGISVALPMALLDECPGYVMKMLNSMRPFSDFTPDAAQLAHLPLPPWTPEKMPEELRRQLAYYAQTGSTRARLYALSRCAGILARLHQAGIVYCDVSPNNVFTNVLEATVAPGADDPASPQPMIIRAASLQDETPLECWLIDADNMRYETAGTDGSWLTTPGLCPPELVDEACPDVNRPRGDCWSFAVMAFKMLALCHPFKGIQVFDNATDWTQTDYPDMDHLAETGQLPFIDDETDASNRRPKNRFSLPRDIVLTPALRLLFQETFGAGRFHPHRRPAMAFWARALAQAFDHSIPCPTCGMSYYWDVPSGTDDGSEELDCCSYCQAPRPALCVIATERGSKYYFATGTDKPLDTTLPHRLFNPFSLRYGYSAASDAQGDHYRITLDFNRSSFTRSPKGPVLPKNQVSFIPAAPAAPSPCQHG